MLEKIVEHKALALMRRKPIHPVVFIASISGSISAGLTRTYTGPWGDGQTTVRPWCDNELGAVL